jgi:hypothetical protein
VVVRVLADVVEVVVLAAGADALLAVGGPLELAEVGVWIGVAEEDGLNWFMPALVKRRVGSSSGTTGEEGMWLWALDLQKKSTKVERTRELVHWEVMKGVLRGYGREVYGSGGAALDSTGDNADVGWRKVPQPIRQGAGAGWVWSL